MGATSDGLLEKRVRTDVRVSEDLLALVGKESAALGIPKNAFFTMGTCLLAVKLIPLVYGKGVRRSSLLKKIDSLFKETLKEARKAP